MATLGGGDGPSGAAGAKVVPLDQLDTDLTRRQLPRLVFVIPNLDHDMHGAGEGGDDPALTTTADHWLAGLYRKLASSVAWHDDTRLVITWDEAANGERAGCCGGLAAGGQVATIITGPQVKAGRDDTPYSHYALLRSIETLLQLPLLGHASDPSITTIPALS